MEEKELLRALGLFLTILYSSILSNQALAASGDDVATAKKIEDKIKENTEKEEDINFANSLSRDAKKAVIEQSLNEIKDYVRQNPNNHLGIDNSYINNQGINGASDDNFILDTEPRLLIFVSTSMPKSLLLEYFKEASKYNGTLVFKGLPNGSFKELTKLILSFEQEVKTSTRNFGKDTDMTTDTKIAASIIDDEAFKKYGVNSVPTIILSKEEECFEGMSCPTTFDKIRGNIGIKAALEEFEKSGDLASIASSFLREKAEDTGDKSRVDKGGR